MKSVLARLIVYTFFSTYQPETEFWSPRVVDARAASTLLQKGNAAAHAHSRQKMAKRRTRLMKWPTKGFLK